MRAQTPSAHTSAPTAPTALTAYTLTPPPTALTAYTPTPHGPYCLHSLLYIES